MLNDDEIEAFIDQNTPANTKRKTKADLNVFQRWLKENVPLEGRSLDEIPANELNQILKSFFITVRKLDGKEYEPDTIKSVQNSLERYLSSKMYGASILRGDEFKSSRDVLSAKRKQLKHEGLGRKPNRAQALSDTEEELLWTTGIMGTDSPLSLQNAIWWRNNFFGLRGRQEHRDMRWGDVVMQTDTEGQQYLEYHERDTKTRKDPRDERPFPPRIYATPNQPDRCPVNILIIYTHKRPVSMMNAESPFYLSLLPEKQLKHDTWFKDCPLGVHSLGNIMKNMAEKIGLTAKLTNHSGRKTTVKRLREAEVESCDIIQLTGHKNVQSVNNYSDVTLKKQRQMSNILVQQSVNTNILSSAQSANSLASVATVATALQSVNQPLPVHTVTTVVQSPRQLIDFGADDGFDQIIASIESFEHDSRGIGKQNHNQENCTTNLPFPKALLPKAQLNNCTFNINIYNNDK